MRKLLLVMCLVLGTASLASAALVPVLTINPVDVGLSGGRLGGVSDPLEAGDVIGIHVKVGHNQYPGDTSKDGYNILGVDVELAPIGAGSLSMNGGGSSTEVDGDNYPYVNGSGAVVMVSRRTNSAGTRNQVVHNGIEFTCDGDGNVLLDLNLATNGHGVNTYRDYKIDGAPYGPTGEANLQELVIYQIPEPFTMSLLGLGALALIRRRKA